MTDYKYNPACRDIEKCLKAMNFWAHRVATLDDNDEAEEQYQLWRYQWVSVTEQEKRNAA